MKNKLLILCLFLVGCNPKANSNESTFCVQLRSIGYECDAEQYLIIPTDICHTCVNESLAFARKHLRTSKIKFIVTSTYGKRSISVRFSTEELQAKNLIIDHKGIFATRDRITFVREGVETPVPPSEIFEFLEDLEKKVE